MLNKHTLLTGKGVLAALIGCLVSGQTIADVAGRVTFVIGDVTAISSNGTKRVLGLFQPIAANVSISRPALRFSLTALLPPDPQMPARPELKVVATN